jgi:hypothetical protein
MKGRGKTYIITTAQRGANPNENFLNGLETLRKERDGNLWIMPTNGRQTTSKRGEDRDEEDKIQNSIRDWAMNHEKTEIIFDDEMSEVGMAEKRKLNQSLYAVNYPVKAQQMIPLTSWDRHVKVDKSAIIASPKMMMSPEPNSKQSLPKILMSTGAMTMPSYKNNNWGTHAYLDHDFAAVLVEVVDDHRYHFRQLAANNKGVFYDLGKRYDGITAPKKENIELMVLGDLHSGETDPEVLKATLKMMREFNPGYVVIHDLFSGLSVNPHEQENEIKRARAANEGYDLLGKELYRCGEMLSRLKKNLPTGSEIVIVRSNHDTFLDRYLQKADFRKSNGKNLSLLYKLSADLIENPIEELAGGALKLGIQRTYGNIEGVRFLRRDEDFKKRGWQFAVHGDQGPGGSKNMGIRTQARVYGKSVTGHSHHPGIFRDAWKVGTSSKLDLGYNEGASNWMHTHLLFYSNGQAQLVNIMDGKYHA